ncbi:hypothetical protein [Actinotalea sp.]|uniref:hypothetical protein n=1 Tax=Actinotalea sp. TaxID=1872145 RepID=UPI00356397CB
MTTLIDPEPYTRLDHLDGIDRRNTTRTSRHEPSLLPGITDRAAAGEWDVMCRTIAGIHTRDDDGRCAEDRKPWPCPTAETLPVSRLRGA